jgi:hypothetical protein
MEGALKKRINRTALLSSEDWKAGLESAACLFSL